MKYWYDIKEISGSHAAVTVSIAGVSLAMLSVLPLFTNEASRIFAKPQISFALLFFFVSFFFGLFASFAYSVVSGDARNEKYRLLAFMVPSVSFGISVSSLFLGFVYVLNACLSGNQSTIFILRTMRVFTLIGILTIGILVSRTILEAILLFNEPCEKNFCTLRGYNFRILICLLFMYGISTFFIIFWYIIYNDILPLIAVDSARFTWYSIVLVSLGIVLPIDYVIATRIRSSAKIQMILPAYTLLFLFNLLLFMDLWWFV